MVKMEWKDETHGLALRRIKRILTTAPVLLTIDPAKPFRLHVDACRRGRGIGAVLLQQNENNGNRWQPVAYWSLKLTDTERSYSATDLECKAMHDAILHWGTYLKTQEFEVITDHYAIVFLVTKDIRDSNGRLMRYIMSIQNFRFGVTHRKGAEHIDADTISRLFRYDESMLRILDRDQLEERGPVTRKDVQELAEQGHQTPYPGIDRKTIEEMLDDIKSRQVAWTDEDKVLINRIILRHVLEQALNTPDDCEEFVDMMEQEVQDGMEEVLSEEVISQLEKLPEYVKSVSVEDNNMCTKTKRKRVTFGIPRSRRHIETDSSQSILSRAETDEVWNDSQGVEEPGRSSSPPLKEDKERCRMWGVKKTGKDTLLKTNTSGGYQLRQRKLKETVAIEKGVEKVIAKKKLLGILGDNEDLHYDEETTMEQEQEVDSLQGLIGSLYEDEGGLYRVINIFYDPKYKRICANREPADGRSRTEADLDSYLVLGHETHILPLVEKYRLEHPEPTLPELSEENILKQQRQDVEYAEIFEALEKIESVDGVKKVMIGGRWYILREGQALRQQRENVTSNEEFTIMRKTEPIELPLLWRREIVRKYHEEKDHPQSARMLKRLRQDFVWKYMSKHVIKFAECCSHCQLRKQGQELKNPPLNAYPIVEKPFERCHIDLCGPFTTTKRGNKYVLVFKDALSKWVEFFALPNKTEGIIAECMVDEVIMRYGPPKLLISDAGKEFANKVLKQVCQLLRTKKITTAPYNPRADGLAENAVKQLKDGLSAYANVYQNDWDEYLSVVAHYYRTTPNDATGFTPYYVLYGRECVDIDTMWLKNVQQQQSLVEYTDQLAERMIIIWETMGLKVRRNGLKMQKKHVNAEAKLKEYQPGQLVVIRRIPKGKYTSVEDGEKYKIRSALQNRWQGPYPVIAKISLLTYNVLVNGKARIVAYANMKQYKVGDVVMEHEEMDEVEDEEIVE